MLVTELLGITQRIRLLLRGQKVTLGDKLESIGKIGGHFY